MLSLVPDLYSYEQFIPLFFRIFLTGMLILQLRYDRSLRMLCISGTLGTLLIVGLFIQPVAFIVGLLQLWHVKKHHVRLYEILPVVVIAWSLLFLGPGILSIDLPL